MNFSQLLAALKDLEPAKRNFVLLLLLFCSINYYLYQENLELKAERKEYDVKCSEMIAKAQTDYLNQLNKNREAQQKELTDYYIKTNKEKDSTNLKYEERINKLKQLIYKSRKDLNNLKHENIN